MTVPSDIAHKSLIVRPPDSQMMTYSELREHFKAWPILLIDELARELAEQDERNDY